MSSSDNSKIVVLLSGGMDSAVLMAHYLETGLHDVTAISFNYGQRHSVELQYAARLAQHYEVDHVIADLGGLTKIMGKSSQTDTSIEVPEGHYAAESMKKTVVPNRNMIMLSVAIAQAITFEAEYVAYAAHAGDHTIYPDCRPEFVEAMINATHLCDWQPPEIVAPFVHKTKTDIAILGASLGVPFGNTWSCYKGGIEHCGVCGTCVERKEAFKQAKIQDLTAYIE